MRGHAIRSDLESIDVNWVDDPGNGAALPAIWGGVKLKIGSGTENSANNILPDPPRPGLSLTLSVFSTGGGSRVYVANTKINAAGNKTITFNALTGVLQLTSIPYAANAPNPACRWQVDFSDTGVTLSA